MNERRRKLMNSWVCVPSSDGRRRGFVGHDGHYSYRVEPNEGGARWMVLIDGEPVRTRSHHVLRTFGDESQACWHAELEAERRSKGAA